MKARILRLALRDRTREGELPLDELLDEALGALRQIGGRPGEKSDMPMLFREKWLAKWAIRAVCEAIVRTGVIPLPLAVTMHWKDGEQRRAPLCAPIPEEFLRYASRQGYRPDFLAGLAMREFMRLRPNLSGLQLTYPVDESHVYARKDAAPAEQKGGQ